MPPDDSPIFTSSPPDDKHWTFPMFDTYGEYVRRLHVQNLARDADQLPWMRDLLAKFPKMRCIKSSSRLSPLIMNPNFPARDTLTELVARQDYARQPNSLDITPDNGTIEASHITELLSFPSLRSLSLKILAHCDDDDSTLPNTVLQSPHVQYFGPRPIMNLLAQCKDLKDLYLRIPDGDERMPSRILPILSFVKKTLVSFQSDGYSDSFSHDGTRLDLSGFVALKNLDICSFCLLPPIGKGYNREGLYSLLPKTLEMLTVCSVLLFTSVLLLISVRCTSPVGNWHHF